MYIVPWNTLTNIFVQKQSVPFTEITNLEIQQIISLFIQKYLNVKGGKKKKSQLFLILCICNSLNRPKMKIEKLPTYR